MAKSSRKTTQPILAVDKQRGTNERHQLMPSKPTQDHAEQSDEESSEDPPARSQKGSDKDSSEEEDECDLDPGYEVCPSFLHLNLTNVSQASLFPIRP